jgi:hypothetical protein
MKVQAFLHAAAAAGLIMAFATSAHAAGSGMPWEGPLEQVVDSITGPVARAADDRSYLQRACGAGCWRGRRTERLRDDWPASVGAA